MSALERLQLYNGHGELEQEHLARYQYAAKFVAGLNVLDIACGTGYGSRLLRDAGAASVMGIDISPEAIDHALNHHAGDGICFVTGDAQNLTAISDGLFDAIVSFETIEHVPNDERFLKEMIRVLKPGGEFIVSTPDFRLGTLGQRLTGKLHNRFHVREYAGSAFLKQLARFFNVTEVCGQKWAQSWAVLLPVASTLKFSAHVVPGKRWKQYVHRLFNPSEIEVSPQQAHPREVPMFWTARCVKPVAFAADGNIPRST